MVVKRKVSDALTGVHLRTSTLPDPGVSGLQNHRYVCHDNSQGVSYVCCVSLLNESNQSISRVGPEPFAIIDESTRTINTSDTDDHAVRKCVYN